MYIDRLRRSDYYNDSTVILDSWGRLEGFVIIDNEPLSNHNVVVNSKAKEITGTLWQSSRLRTDEQWNVNVFGSLK